MQVPIRLRRAGGSTLAAWLLVVVPVLAQSDDPQLRERAALQAVAGVLQARHLSGIPLDDDVSRRALDAFVDAVDPDRMYLDAVDVAALEPFADRLDDLLRAGDPRLATMVHGLMVERVAERTAWAEALLDTGFDFTVEEMRVVDRERVQRAADEAEARERWRLRVKHDVLALRVEGVAADEIDASLRRRYERLPASVQRTSRDQIVAMFVNAVTTSFDPHTNYLSARTLEDFNIRMRLNYQGIGARLTERDGRVVIGEIMPGGAAERQGDLTDGDWIKRVGEGDGELEDIEGLRLDEVVDRIRGAEGSTVRLEVVAAGGEPRVIGIVRSRMELTDAAARGEVIERATADGTPLRIGVVALPSFYGDGEPDGRAAATDVRRVLAGFRDDGVGLVVLDLRHNGGGLLSEAIAVTGLFIETGPVVQVRDGRDRVQVLADDDPEVAWDGPLVVLTSRFSASASEIVAGAVQDYRRGLVIGDETTHGKGTVQRVIDLSAIGGMPDLGALKLTVQQFYRPDGLSTQNVGVRADVHLPSFTDVLVRGESELPNALPSDRIRGADHPRFAKIDDGMLEELRRASARRQSEDAEFIEFRAAIDAAAVRIEQAEVPLDESAYRATRDALSNLPTAGPADADQPLVATDDPWWSEVLSIARDYAVLATRS